MPFDCSGSCSLLFYYFSQNYPKIAIVTGGYKVFSIRYSPVTVAFHSKSDLIIEMLHL